MLCNHKEGPALLCAALFTLHQAMLPEVVTLIPSADSSWWGNCKYHAPLLMPKEEERYYNILKGSEAKLVHWWRQLCLNWPCLKADLQKTS